VLGIGIDLDDLSQFLPSAKKSQNFVFLTNSTGQNIVSNTSMDKSLRHL
jgi:adenosyl cobinamide kinase/adenosyl cobinamide phosphate guanylyltransferase